MTTSPGMVYTTAGQDRAVFLTAGDLETLRESIAAIEERPTVAGPPLDVDALERLSRALSMSSDAPVAAAPSPITLSMQEQECLELLRDQASIRAGLPLRIRRTCTACGNSRIVNPARQAKSAASGGSSEMLNGTFVNSVQLLSEGHPFLAALSFVGGLRKSEAGAADPTEVCERCDGDDFAGTVVTFCPGCRAIRDESVLLACPDCEFDFAARRTGDQMWTTPEQAVAESAMAFNVASFRECAGRFENGLWPGQLEALVQALGADDQLLGMCRCAVPGEVGRYVALLFTSRQLVWARKSPFSDTTGAGVAWRDLATVREHGASGPVNERGIRFELRDGTALVFKDFRGAGVNFGDRTYTYAVEDVYRLAAGLQAPYRVPDPPAPPAPPVPPAPPRRPVSPAPPPAPGPPPRPLPPPAPAPAPPRPAPPAPAPAPPRPAPPAPAPAPPRPAPPPPARQPAPVPVPRPPAGPVSAGQAVPPGWYPDPWRIARLRWWSGRQWTNNIMR